VLASATVFMACVMISRPIASRPISGALLREDRSIDPDAAMVVGRVLDSATGLPVMGAPISAMRPDVDLGYAVGVTDAAGVFRVHLASGAWLLFIRSPPEYDQAYMPRLVSRKGPLTVTIRDGKDQGLGDLRVILWPKRPARGSATLSSSSRPRAPL